MADSLVETQEKYVKAIKKDLKEARRLVDELEKDISGPRESRGIVQAVSIGYLTETVGKLAYNVGVFNGLVLK